jgi:hypothetical protein
MRDTSRLSAMPPSKRETLFAMTNAVRNACRFSRYEIGPRNRIRVPIKHRLKQLQHPADLLFFVFAMFRVARVTPSSNTVKAVEP